MFEEYGADDLGPCTNRNCKGYGKLYDGVRFEFQKDQKGNPIESSCPLCRPVRQPVTSKILEEEMKPKTPLRDKYSSHETDWSLMEERV